MIVLMEQFIIYLALVLFGAIFGSFAAATVWRLRAYQLQGDKNNKKPYDKKEYKRLEKLTGRKLARDRSCCLECGYELQWYDLIPVVSWVALKGKCRKCRRPIGFMEPLAEVSLALFFALSYLLWPGGVVGALGVTHFLLWLAAGVAMAIIFMYDFKWFLVPDSVILVLGVIGLAITVVSAFETQDAGATIMTAVGAMAILGGLYAVLYAVSRGRWVGFGDVILGFALALVLVDWQLALLALFLANLVGCIVVIPGLATKKLHRTSHVPFGPMLIAGTVLAWFFGWAILRWYLGLMGM